MGPMYSPLIPTAWRERHQSPLGQRKVGLELIGRKKNDGTDAIYWGKDCAECYELAESDGWYI